MGADTQYFLQLTESQMETLKFVMGLFLYRPQRGDNPDLRHFLQQLHEVHELLAEAPTHVAGAGTRRVAGD